MKAIIITDDIILKNTAFRNFQVGSIYQQGFPNAFYVTENVANKYPSRTDLHDADGWLPVVFPTLGQYDYYGPIELSEDETFFTFPVLTYSDEEIKQQKDEQAAILQQEYLQQKAKNDLEVQLQLIVNDAEVLSNQPGYSLWDSFPIGYLFADQFKVQSFDDNLDLKMFRCIQPHGKQLANEPNLAAALWTKIEFSGGIEVWSQPIGGDGKYPYIDPTTGEPYLVSFEGQTWQNYYEDGLNVWKPGEFGWIIFAG